MKRVAAMLSVNKQFFVRRLVFLLHEVWKRIMLVHCDYAEAFYHEALPGKLHAK